MKNYWEEMQELQGTGTPTRVGATSDGLDPIEAKRLKNEIEGRAHLFAGILAVVAFATAMIGFRNSQPEAYILTFICGVAAAIVALVTRNNVQTALRNALVCRARVSEARRITSGPVTMAGVTLTFWVGEQAHTIRTTAPVSFLASIRGDEALIIVDRKSPSRVLSFRPLPRVFPSVETPKQPKG